MRLDFDPAKDAANLARHGVSLAMAAELDWDSALVWVDDRFDYMELHIISLILRYRDFDQLNRLMRRVGIFFRHNDGCHTGERDEFKNVNHGSSFVLFAGKNARNAQPSL